MKTKLEKIKLKKTITARNLNEGDCVQWNGRILQCKGVQFDDMHGLSLTLNMDTDVQKMTR